MEVMNALNEKIVELKTAFWESNVKKGRQPGNIEVGQPESEQPERAEPEKPESEEEDHTPSLEMEYRGRFLFDATVCLQDIAIPTGLDLLSEARVISERLLDSVYDRDLHGEEPCTYRQKARKEYLQTAQKKKKTKKQIRTVVRKQLGYLGRNIRSINDLLDVYQILPFRKRDMTYFYVIQALYCQQLTMYRTHAHTIEDRIVSIHHPYVRPMVRGKACAPCLTVKVWSNFSAFVRKLFLLPYVGLAWLNTVVTSYYPIHLNISERGIFKQTLT